MTNIQWCTAADIDAIYNLGVSTSGQIGTLDGKTFVLTVDAVTSTLPLSCSGNAATQTTFMAALDAQWPGLTFTINPLGQLYIDPSVHTVTIGAGTANDILGFVAGLLSGPVPGTNSLSYLMFGTTIPLDTFWATSAGQLAITSAISLSGSVVESRLRTRYFIPNTLAYIPQDLKICAAIIAGYQLLINRGYNPNNISTDIDAVYKERYDWAIQELHNYSTNRIHPDLQLIDYGIPQNWAQPQNGTFLGVAGMASQQLGQTRGY